MKARSILPAATLLVVSGLAYAFKRNKGKKFSSSATLENQPGVDADMQNVLDVLGSLGAKPIETLSPEEARKQPTPADAVKKVMRQQGKSPEPETGFSVHQRVVHGPAGPIPIHIYTPPGAGPFPVLVYYHGGGFVIADTQTYDASPRTIAKGADAIVVAVDYRQAPEHKFPSAAEDAYAAYEWVKHHAQDFNGDPQRVAVGGESAGGNLATVVSMMARDRQFALPLHQLLVYPVVGDDFNTPSYLENAEAKPLNKAMMQWFFKHYADKPGDAESSYAMPMKASSLAGLPSATVITAQIDPLRSEGKAYAERLEREGVNVVYKNYEGVTHEFFGMGAVVGKARDAEDFACAQLKKAFTSLH